MPVHQLQDQDNDHLSHSAKQAIIRAKTSWLKNTEVMDLLVHHQEYRLPISSDPPNRPAGGTLYLFDKKQERFFRRDGHHWRKKANGKTVRETHEKLKVDNKDTLNCYYTHSEKADALQRRCYWLLEQDDSIVLVHYLSGTQSRNRQLAGSVSASQSHHNQVVASGDVPSNDCGRREDAEAGWLQADNAALTDPAQDRLAYCHALQAKKLSGDLIQPTAIHAAAFAYGPLFRALDATERFQRQKQFEELAAKAHREQGNRTQDEDGGLEPREPASQPLEPRTNDGMREAQQASALADAPNFDPAQAQLPEPSESRGTSDADSEIHRKPEFTEPKAKRRRGSQASEMSCGEMMHRVLDTSQEIVAQFRQSTERLVQHLQEQRQADDKFRQDMLNLERERAQNERESLTAIAAAVIGQFSGAGRPGTTDLNSNQIQPHSHNNINPSPVAPRYIPASIPFGAFGHGVALNGLNWPAPYNQDSGR